MMIYPTIELQNGRCVSLHRGRLEEAPTLVATCRQALAILIEQVERRAAREA